MKIHANAKTCPKSRRLLIRRIEEQGWSLMEAAEAAGISDRTAAKWLARWRAEGEAGLRGAGLSGVKARYVLNLAEAVADGRVPLGRIGALDDEAIVASLTSVRGIGRWTAEMFLIFALNRPDVLPLGDFGVRVGLRDHYGLPELPAPRQCIALAEPWRPYRTVAMWYLWRRLDGAAKAKGRN